MTAVITGVVALVIFINKCSLMLPTFLTLSQRISQIQRQSSEMETSSTIYAPLFTINQPDYFE